MTKAICGRAGYVAGMYPPSTGGGARRRPVAPTLRLERRLLRCGAARLGGMDEVGRGAPAGPVHVGLVVLDGTTGRPPSGVRDSKLLTAPSRRRQVPGIQAWAAAYAVGSASPAEVDALGVNDALRLAGLRALGQMDEPPDVVLLDGSYDWLSSDGPTEAGTVVATKGLQVISRVKADLSCTSVAAASILAKVARDAVMVGLACNYPSYGWEANKGYGSEAHLTAIRTLGLTPHHRHSWRLPLPG
jgi:ribonuclease HII